VSSPDPQMLQGIAAECVRLVREEFGRDLDGSLASLGVLDDVCATLTADGPLTGNRLELWAKLAGAYTGEVTIRAHGGQWVSGSSGESGPPAIRALDVTGHPFSTAVRVLSAEPGKSLASFARALPAISEHARRRTGA
jgi:hypothetical protein